jgi:hypothetical protein
MFRDNITSINDCCTFCNANLRCIIWVLDVHIGRCWLKYNRGAKLIKKGVFSGFSNSYFTSVSTPMPDTTTVKTTMSTIYSSSPTIKTTTTSPMTTNSMSKCNMFDGVEYVSVDFTPAININDASVCCDFCVVYKMCNAYTYYPANRTCMLFDIEHSTLRYCPPSSQCISGSVIMNSTRTTTATTTTTSSSQITTTTKQPQEVLQPLVTITTTTPSNGTKKCFYENGIFYYSPTVLAEISNSNLSHCCGSCFNDNRCMSWTLVTLPSMEHVCRLFDSFRPNPSSFGIGYQSGFSEKSLAYVFYSVFDLYQLKVANLSGNYSFVKMCPYCSVEQFELLKLGLNDIESKLKPRLDSLLNTSIFKIMFDKISHSNDSLFISFMVVLDPRIKDFQQAVDLLNTFNTYIRGGKYPFNDMVYYNETFSQISLLPNVSNFSRKFQFILIQLFSLFYLKHSICLSVNFPKI